MKFGSLTTLMCMLILHCYFALAWFLLPLVTKTFIYFLHIYLFSLQSREYGIHLLHGISNWVIIISMKGWCAMGHALHTMRLEFCMFFINSHVFDLMGMLCMESSSSIKEFIQNFECWMQLLKVLWLQLFTMPSQENNMTLEWMLAKNE